jgi:4-hydroxy-tetrahydrodipicolinate synthase
VSAVQGDRRPTGVVCPIVTPLTSSGELDEDVFRQLIDALVPDLDGLFVLGSSGELTRLPDRVVGRTARVATEQVGGRIPVYLGIGDTGLDRTLERAERLADVGADYLVVSAPFYYPVTPDALLVGYFEAIADRVPRPIVLYNIPQTTHVPLPPDVVRMLAPHPRIVGIKDSAGDPFQFAQLLAVRTDDFRLLQGREELTASSTWAGADGVISAMGNFAPRLLRTVIRSVHEGRPRTETLALQAVVDRLAGVFAQGYWLSGLKATLIELGWDVGEPSRPMPVYGEAERAAVRRILEATGHEWLTRQGRTP